MLIVEVHAGTAATHHAVPTGAGGSSPDVRQGALGGRRSRLDVVTSGSGAGRAFPARPEPPGRVDTKDFASYYTLPVFPGPGPGPLQVAVRGGKINFKNDLKNKRGAPPEPFLF